MQIKNNKGVSLIELMISMVIGLFVLAGILSVFSSVRATSSETTSIGRLQENGRFVVTLLSEDLMRQGFFGELSVPLSTNVLASSVSPLLTANDCIGDGLNNATIPLSLGHFRTLYSMRTVDSNPMNCIDDAKSGSDILQIKRALSSELVSGIDTSRYYIKSNLSSAALFKGGSTVADIEFGKVWEYQHHVYYVREESVGSNVIPVLMRSRLQNNELIFDPLVDGVEVLYFQFGVDTDSDGVSNFYLPSTAMNSAFWDNENGIRLIAVKLFVLMRDTQPDMLYSNTNTYTLGDRDITFNDNYRRMVFSSTINLVNSRVQEW